MPFPYKRILCPVDLDGDSDEALKEATALISSGTGVVEVLHVVRINPLVDQGASEGFAATELYESQVSFARRQVDQMIARIPNEAKCEVSIVIGEPGERILETASSSNADLIVMASHGRSGVQRLVLGSIADRIVREAKVPVLTLRSTSKPPE